MKKVHSERTDTVMECTCILWVLQVSTKLLIRFSKLTSN